MQLGFLLITVLLGIVSDSVRGISFEGVQRDDGVSKASSVGSIDAYTRASQNSFGIGFLQKGTNSTESIARRRKPKRRRSVTEGRNSTVSRGVSRSLILVEGGSPAEYDAILFKDISKELKQEWDHFMLKYNKNYGSHHHERECCKNFIRNRNRIKKFNQNNHSFKQKVNSYADMVQDDFDKLLNGFSKNLATKKGQQKGIPANATYLLLSSNITVSNNKQHIDWRESGAVSAVKNQGNCAGCFAFSAAGALEGHYFRKTGKRIELSVQNLIDCTAAGTTRYENEGCSGGVPSIAFEYIRDNGGLDTESAYPFEGKGEQQCRYRKEGFGAQSTGYMEIEEGDERTIELIVNTLGPVSACIDASLSTFHFYSEGLYYDPDCESDPDSVNHAVLIVGYGTEPSGEQYWLVKNSYGTGWGNDGYIKMPKFRNNHCGIATYASYPLV